MALPFEEQEGLPFEASGLPFETEEPEERSYMDRVTQEAVPAVLNVGGDILRSIPAGIRGAGQAIATGSMEEGLMGFESSMEYLREKTPRFQGQEIEESEQALQEGLEQIYRAGGSAAEALKTKYNIPALVDPNYKPPMEGDPLARTMGEVATEFAPIPGAELLSMRRARKGARQVEVQKAQDLLDRAQQAEAEIKGEEVEQARYQQAYEQLDNLMMRYPKDYQAPQLGMGGKVAKHPDSVKAEQRARADQEAFDADLRSIAQVEAARSAQMTEQARFSEMRGPATSPTRKPHITGPQAESLTIPEAAAAEVSRKMQEARRDAARIAPDQIRPVGAKETVSQDYTIKRAEDFADTGNYEVTYQGETRKIFRDPGGEWYLDPSETGKHFTENFLGFNKADAITRLKRDIEHKAPRLRSTTRKPVGAQERRVPGFNPKLHELQTGLRWNNTRGYFEEIPTSSRMQLEAIRDHSEIPVFKEIAQLLLADKEFNPKFEIKSLEEIREATKMASDAAFDQKSYSIWMPLKGTGKEALVLHEFVHAATFGAIEHTRGGRVGGYYSPADAASPFLKPVQRLQDLFNNFLDDYRLHSKEPVLPYGLTNIHEFMAEGFTNPEFQALLARTKLPTHLRKGGIRNYWDRFVEAIGNLLGFDQNKHNYLSELIRTGADIIQGSTSEVRRIADKSLDMNMPGAFELKDFKQQLKDANVKLPDSVVKAMFEAKQEPVAAPKAHPTEGAATSAATKFQREYADRRSLEEMAAELKNVKEDTLADQASYNTVGKILQGRFIAHGNPLLSWVSSKAHWVKQEATERANKLMHGENRRNPDPGTANYLWKNFNKDSKEAVREVTQVLKAEEAWLGEAGIQAKAREVLGRELTRNELQSYLDRNRTSLKALEDFNKFLVAEGREPIPPLPHYGFPSVHEGPFLAKFIDKAGNTVKTESFYFRPKESKLQKAAPDYKIEIIEKDIRADIDVREFESILRQLSKEQRDPAAKAIAEGIRRMSIHARGMKRKGVKGALGEEKGIKGIREYEEVYERSIRNIYDFIANRELDKIKFQVRDLKEANHLPHTKTWAFEALDAATGGSNKTFDALSRDLSAAVTGTIAIGTGGKLRLPQRFTRDLLRQGNKVKTTLLLGFFNPIHIGAQLLQAPTFMPPKLLAMAAEAGINPARIMNVMARSLGEYSKWNKSKDAAMLEKIGAFDATFKYDWSTYAGDSSPHYKRSLYDHATGLSTLMWVESHAVRRPAAHMFLEMLREIGYDKIAKDKMEIYKVAREMTDHYMVSMRFYEKPHVFSRTGLVGMAFSPLKSFATTWLGMLREYTKLSASGLLEGSVAKSTPIAAFLAANLLTAGMLGFVGIKEWDVLAKLLNDSFGFNVPSGTEWVASKFKSKGMRYGLLSEALPWDISVGPTFTGPSLAESYFWSAPGLGLYADAAKFAATGIAATGAFGESNVPGPAAQREAMKGMAPRFSPLPGYNWGDIEKIMTPEGQPYAEASGKAGPVTRTPEDWRARRLGTYTTREREEKLRFYEAQKRVKTMGKQVGRAVDIILSNKGMDKLPELWKELGEKNFSAQEIQTALKREIYDRLIESDIRALGTSMSPKQQRLWMLYQQLEGAPSGQQ